MGLARSGAVRPDVPQAQRPGVGPKAIWAKSTTLTAMNSGSFARLPRRGYGSSGVRRRFSATLLTGWLAIAKVRTSPSGRTAPSLLALLAGTETPLHVSVTRVWLVQSLQSSHSSAALLTRAVGAAVADSARGAVAAENLRRRVGVDALAGRGRTRAGLTGQFSVQVTLAHKSTSGTSGAAATSAAATSVTAASASGTPAVAADLPPRRDRADWRSGGTNQRFEPLAGRGCGLADA